MFTDFRDKEEERKKHQLVASHTYPTEDGRHKLLIYGTFQQTEPPGQSNGTYTIATRAEQVIIILCKNIQKIKFTVVKPVHNIQFS